MKRLLITFLLLTTAFVATAATLASAAPGYTTYVGCSATASAAPSHVCRLGDEPGAFFESPEAEVEYEVCVAFPNAETLCSEEELAEEGILYVNQITSDLPGTHLATWYVEGVEVASWSFQIDAPPAPIPPPVVAPPPAVVPVPPAPKPLTCGKGFRKKTVAGKARCVKKPKHRHRRHQR